MLKEIMNCQYQNILCIQEEIIEMNNGCICCTVRGDLIEILHRLLQRKDPLDAILIETTGLADPAPVAQTFFVDDFLQVNNG
jgi:G3E family GTPase